MISQDAGPYAWCLYGMITAVATPALWELTQICMSTKTLIR